MDAPELNQLSIKYLLIMRKSNVFFVWMYRVFGVLSVVVAIACLDPEFMGRHDFELQDMLFSMGFFAGIGILLFSCSFLFEVNNSKGLAQPGIAQTGFIAGLILTIASMLCMIILP